MAGLAMGPQVRRFQLASILGHLLSRPQFANAIPINPNGSTQLVPFDVNTKFTKASSIRDPCANDLIHVIQQRHSVAQDRKPRVANPESQTQSSQARGRSISTLATGTVES
jgi:hypothetical protein